MHLVALFPVCNDLEDILIENGLLFNQTEFYFQFNELLVLLGFFF